MESTVVEGLGPKIRRQRRKLGLTLDELAGRTGISKPYLSLIENNRVLNPPSDEKLRKLEQSLGFPSTELVSQAHLQRTPADVRAMLMSLSASAAPAITTSVVTHATPPAALAALAEPALRVAPESVGCPDVTDKDCFAVRVSDDRMMPKYRAGDIVIFSPALTARDGDDCFVRLSDGRTAFHRVFFEAGDGGEPVVRLQPRNERHRALIVPAERIAAVSKAVYKYQRVDEE